MSESAITQCPKCDTCFKVTLAQMSVASGAVRCGACLLVFKADEYFTEVSRARGDVFTQEMFPVAEVNEDVIVDVKIETLAVEGVGEAVAEGDEELLSGANLNIEASNPDDMVGSIDAPPGKGLSNSLFGGLSLILLVGLGLQYVWFNQTYFAQHANARPYLNIVCQQLGCQVPDYDQKALISSSGLIVRSHSTLKGLLQVDAVIKNGGQFPQKFPPLQLSFADKFGEIVARRQIKPKEYLAGELKGVRYMPANTEVRISLEIVDPGGSAVGYMMEIVP